MIELKPNFTNSNSRVLLVTEFMQNMRLRVGSKHQLYIDVGDSSSTLPSGKRRSPITRQLQTRCTSSSSERSATSNRSPAKSKLCTFSHKTLKVSFESESSLIGLLAKQSNGVVRQCDGYHLDWSGCGVKSGNVHYFLVESLIACVSQRRIMTYTSIFERHESVWTRDSAEYITSCAAQTGGRRLSFVLLCFQSTEFCWTRLFPYSFLITNSVLDLRDDRVFPFEWGLRRLESREPIRLLTGCCD